MDVRLRDVTEDDLPTFFEHQRDPEANRVAAFPARDREAFDAHWGRILGDDTVIAKTVLRDGRPAGNVVGFERDGRREIGFWIGREHWGQGIATRALSEFLRHVRERPVFAHVARGNVGSLRILEKCGFAVSGERPDELVLTLER